MFTFWKIVELMLRQKYHNYLGDLINRNDTLQRENKSIFYWFTSFFWVSTRNRLGEERLGKRISSLNLYNNSFEIER